MFFTLPLKISSWSPKIHSSLKNCRLFFTESLKDYTSTVPNEISQITEMKLLINSCSVKIITVSQGGCIAGIFVQPFRSGKEALANADF